MKIKINNKEFDLEELLNKGIIDKDINVMNLCNKLNYYIPHLCYDQKFNKAHNVCRLCIVKINNKITTSCNIKAFDLKENTEIITNDPELEKQRKINLGLVLSNHNNNCNQCSKNLQCELQKISNLFNITHEDLFIGETRKPEIDKGIALIKDHSKCILCGRCIDACKVNAIGYVNRGFNTRIAVFNNDYDNSICVFCGQCIMNCPTGALYENYQIDKFYEILQNKKQKENNNYKVAVQIAPSVRVAIGEAFNVYGKNLSKKIVSALKLIGIDYVFDTQFGADLTIIEETAEFMKRLNNEYHNNKLPLFTSCCPAWVRFVEIHYPEFKSNLSTSKSPQEMLASIVKYYYKNKLNENIKVISIMPCVAKKYESSRSFGEVDCVITTREFIKILKQFMIDLTKLKDSEFDPIFGESSGAGDIFGVSGGVLEAALRTAYEKYSNKRLDCVEFNQLRGNPNIRTGEIIINNKTIRFAAASGLDNAKYILEHLDDFNIDILEVMACPNGCINGGGQPFFDDNKILELRRKAIYESDKSKVIRRSYENPSIKFIYNEILKEPLSELSERLLHVNYDKK